MMTALQDSAGNRAVARMIASNSISPSISTSAGLQGSMPAPDFVVQRALDEDQVATLGIRLEQHLESKSIGVPSTAEWRFELSQAATAFDDVDKAFDKLSLPMETMGALNDMFESPEELWGLTESDIGTLLESVDWDPSDYGGTSTAYEWIKDLGKYGKMSLVINYGGGRHTHSIGKQVFDTPYYYKLERPNQKKTKIIDPKVYPEVEWKQQKKWRIIDGTTGSALQ